jgi:hypothetical protein
VCCGGLAIIEAPVDWCIKAGRTQLQSGAERGDRPMPSTASGFEVAERAGSEFRLRTDCSVKPLERFCDVDDEGLTIQHRQTDVVGQMEVGLPMGEGESGRREVVEDDGSWGIVLVRPRPAFCNGGLSRQTSRATVGEGSSRRPPFRAASRYRSMPTYTLIDVRTPPLLLLIALGWLIGFVTSPVFRGLKRSAAAGKRW